MAEYIQDQAPYNKEQHRKIFDAYLATKKKERSILISRFDYKRILRGFRNGFKNESAQFKHRITKLRKFTMEIDDEDDEPFLQGNSNFNKTTRRNPIVWSEEIFNALYAVHYRERCHVGRLGLL